MKRLLVVLIAGLVLASAARADFADEVMADGPVAYYRFEENAGATTLVDSSGNGHGSLEVSNVVFGAAGSAGSAGTFSNAYVELNLQLDPDAGSFTIEAIARFDTTDTARHIASQSRSLLYRNSEGKLNSSLGGDASLSTDALSQGEWHHVVMTVEDDGTNDTLRFYIDGQVSGTNTVTAEATTANWILGASKTYEDGLIGALDEVAIYTNALSASRIKAHSIFANPSRVEDSDGDGLSDYIEVKRVGTDPLDADTDNDGLEDLELPTVAAWGGGVTITARRLCPTT